MLIDRRTFFGILWPAGLLSSCGPRPITERWPFHMGDRVRCGWFSFNVLEIGYKSQLGDGTLAKRPKDGFLLVRLQATSSAGETVSIPSLRLETANGELLPELEDASGLDGWFGLLRRVDPGATETGWLAFDAAPGVYGLRLSDGVLDDEHTSMVNLPFQVGFTIKQ